jgi:hypothetical protein
MHFETLITRLPNDTIYVRMIIRIEVALYAIQGAGPNSVILDFRQLILGCGFNFKFKLLRNRPANDWV